MFDPARIPHLPVRYRSLLRLNSTDKWLAPLSIPSQKRFLLGQDILLPLAWIVLALWPGGETMEMELQRESILKRKEQHLAPFRTAERRLPRTSWLECVQLVHQALPELDLDQVDTSCEIAGHRLRAPLFITGMTGGTPLAGRINRSLAALAERLGLGFGLGSGRAMLKHPETAGTYMVREEAPEVFLAWNIGGCQLAGFGTARIREAMDSVGADALCVHLNPAQELVQPEGDRSFRGVLEALSELVERLGKPVIVKECGAGLSRETMSALARAGVEWVDLSGVGGTCWVDIELSRNGEDGRWFSPLRQWGIPTAASLLESHGLGLGVIASGGIRDCMDVARSIALGAQLCGMAAPVLREWFRNGPDGCFAMLSKTIEGLRRVMLLCGCSNLKQLRQAPRVILPPLSEWAKQRLGR